MAFFADWLYDYQQLQFICLTITLTLEFCAQPLRPVWPMYVQIAELEKYVEFRAIKNLSGFNGFTYDNRSKDNFSLGFDNTDYQTNKLQNVHALHCTLIL